MERGRERGWKRKDENKKGNVDKEKRNWRPENKIVAQTDLQWALPKLSPKFTSISLASY